MILYIAGAFTPKLYLSMADRAGAKNFLFSFAWEEAQECARYFIKQRRPELRLLIDSGAFTAWKKATQIDIQHYIQFAKELRSSARCPIEFIGLDIIADGNATSDETEEACRQGFQNYEEMEAAGVQCLPTFHRGDPWPWLDRIAARAERFCLAPRVDGAKTTVKIEWLENCFKRLGESAWKTHRIHGLGISSAEIMETFPFYSVDSTAASVAVAKFLSYRYFDGRQAVMIPKDEWRYEVCKPQLASNSIGDPSAIQAIHHYRPQGSASKDGQFGTYWFQEQGMKAEVQLEAYLTEHWAYRGVCFDGVADNQTVEP